MDNTSAFPDTLQPPSVSPSENVQTVPEVQTDAHIPSNFIISRTYPSTEYQECEGHTAHATKLAGQENWGEISALLKEADRKLAKTSGGVPVADLIAQGAVADILNAYQHALIDGIPDKKTPYLQLMDAIEDILKDNPDDYAIAAILATAHMQMGWTWQGTHARNDCPPARHAVFQAHFKRAKEILSPFQDMLPRPAFLALAFAKTHVGDPLEHEKIASAYQRAVLVDATNTQVLREMGYYMLPRWFGSYQKLERQARWAETQSNNYWGKGAYTWVQMDAILHDSHACARVDTAQFIAGFHDILKRAPEQNMVNFLAAYCTVSLKNAPQNHDLGRKNQQHIVESANWIVLEHLHEIHPLIWAQAAQGQTSKRRMRALEPEMKAGASQASQIIDHIFATQINQIPNRLETR